jgi:O-methyltransferase involved in polyketide biosynthesis
VKEPRGDLSVTALYTSAAWAWGELPNARLLASVEATRVFKVVNVALTVARLFFTRLPSLAHSLLHRHTMIDHLLAASGATRVIELACGLSRRGVTFSGDPGVTYVEVDLPHVVEKKRALLARDALARPNWQLVEGDVSTLALGALLPDARAATRSPLFVIAEGLLMYLDAASQRALFASVAARLRSAGGGTFVFDLVPACEQPRPGLIGRALSWLMKRFTGGKGFVRDTRTRGDIEAELRASGFDEVQLLEPQAVAREWHLPFPDADTQQLVFVGRSARIDSPTREPHMAPPEASS